jgi:hypothetical protein
LQRKKKAKFAVVTKPIIQQRQKKHCTDVSTQNHQQTTNSNHGSGSKYSPFFKLASDVSGG